jgi:hypothetical protein
MCNRKDCGDPDNTKPWCGDCDGHTQEATMELHRAVSHHYPDPPPPPPAG